MTTLYTRISDVKAYVADALSSSEGFYNYDPGPGMGAPLGRVH